jgi:Short C-terminal domain
MRRRRVGRAGRPGLIGTMARTAVVAGTATAVSGGIARRQHERMQQAADADAWRQQQMAPPPAMAVAAPPAPATDLVTQLKELAALKDRGILTEEEFAAQKARILAT